MVRNPFVAGQFYPAYSSVLEKQLSELINKKSKKTDCLGIMSPHAGYIYSGGVAGAVFSRIKVKNTAIILGPNHSGSGKPFSMMTETSWQMPQGEVHINKALAKKLLAASKFLEEDPTAHTHEHSIEVQLPFLQYIKKDFKLIPIVISQSDIGTYKKLGQDIAKTVKKSKEDVIIIASSDMTHYEGRESAEKKDKLAIEAILELNEEKLIDRVSSMDISMCGSAPVAVMLSACKALGAESSELVDYKTSGDISGDYSSVVGYAGIIIK